jgi:hypothetical protein
MPGAFTTALQGLWPITGPETRSLSDALDDPPRKRGFLERLPRPSRGRSRPRGQAIRAAESQSKAPVFAIQEKRRTRRRGDLVRPRDVKYRALAIRLADEYLWFWIGEPNVYDAIIS